MPIDLKIVIVSEHASAKYGGEAALPLHYFRVLRERGEHVWLVVHARTRDELSQLFPGETRIRYIEDSAFHRTMWRLSKGLPARVTNATFGYAMRIATQLAQRRIVKQLVTSDGINVVHQPMPVSPREPSLMYGVNAAVVIGPMNGAIDFPPAFSAYEGKTTTLVVSLGRKLSGLLNQMMPGKLQCAVLAVANERTRRALPSGSTARVIELVENGVDLRLWTSRQGSSESATATADIPRFVFIGRLVDWKAVDLLLAAFRDASARTPMSLTIVGDGEEGESLRQLSREWGLFARSEGETGKVFFAGWRSQTDCADILKRSSALVLPSLMECGGAVVLEAMAASRPVIATDWGGPADYIDPSCGFLVKPESRAVFIANLADAMVKLAESPDLRSRMGLAGRAKTELLFDWEKKVQRMVEIYAQAIADRGAVHR